MLLSKIPAALRAATTLQKNKNILANLFVRNHGDVAWSYRTLPLEPKKHLTVIADVIQGFAWWWVLWHCWTEPGHIVGEFEYPDAKKWTDEELGIPNDLELD